MSFKYRLLSTHVRRLIYVSDGYNSTYIIAVIDYYFSRVEESLRKTRKVIGSKCCLISVTEAFYLSFFLQNKLLPNQANKEEFITRHTFWFAFGKNKWSEELDVILFNIDNAINAAEEVLFSHSKEWELIPIIDFFVLCHEQIIFLMIPISAEQAPDDYYRVCSRSNYINRFF